MKTENLDDQQRRWQEYHGDNYREGQALADEQNLAIGARAE